MMPKKRFYLYLFSLLMLCLSMGVSPDRLHAQTDSPLPDDLLFSTGSVNADGLPQAHNILARLDAATGQVSTFYTDESAVYLKALRWSPDGDRLAYVRAEYDGRHYPAQLCLLSRDGEAQGCFDDAPVGYFSVNAPNEITWSPDGDRLYYVGGDETVRRLLEADVTSRKTLRVVYEYPVPENQRSNPPALAWTDDLAYLTIGAGDKTRVQRGMPVLLLALDSGQTIDLAHLPGTEGSSLFVVCPFFSPRGSYLTAYNFDVPETPAAPQFLIVDKQGSIVSAIKPTAPLNVLPTSCPTWQTDEAAFYFPLSQGTPASSTLRILKYALDSQQFSVAFDSGDLGDLAEATVLSQMSLSPDEQLLAFDSPFDPGVDDGTQVAVISLAQTPPTLRRYSPPFPFSSDPLWNPSPEPVVDKRF